MPGFLVIMVDMLSFRDLANGFRQLELDPDWPVMVHASLSAFGEVRGGAETLLGALLAGRRALLMPAFTYKTMLTPEDGPADNAIRYGRGRDQNLMAEFFSPDMPVDPVIGVLAETLRRQPSVQRSSHPVLSFCGIQVEAALNAQNLGEPLAPIGVLASQAGWVILAGVHHTANTSLHYAERLAGRPQFVRWALTQDGVREIPGFPGCSDGFEKIAVSVQDLLRQVQIGGALVRAYPLQALVERAAGLIRQDPLALLCEQAECERCGEIRRRFAAAN